MKKAMHATRPDDNPAPVERRDGFRPQDRPRPSAPQQPQR